MGLRNESYNQSAYNSPVALSCTNGVKRILPIALSAARGNLWATFKVVARPWKNRILLHTM
jgi:hypothetical protein